MHFSDAIWNKVSSRRKKGLKLKFDEDGEFYMSVSSFKQFFGKLDICHLTPDGMDSSAAIVDAIAKDGTASDCCRCKVKFDQFDFDDEWTPGSNAGGCGNEDQGGLRSYATNPQVGNFENLPNAKVG